MNDNLPLTGEGNLIGHYASLISRTCDMVEESSQTYSSQAVWDKLEELKKTVSQSYSRSGRIVDDDNTTVCTLLTVGSVTEEIGTCVLPIDLVVNDPVSSIIKSNCILGPSSPPVEAFAVLADFDKRFEIRDGIYQPVDGIYKPVDAMKRDHSSLPFVVRKSENVSDLLVRSIKEEGWERDEGSYLLEEFGQPPRSCGAKLRRQSSVKRWLKDTLALNKSPSVCGQQDDARRQDSGKKLEQEKRSGYSRIRNQCGVGSIVVSFPNETDSKQMT